FKAGWGAKKEPFVSFIFLFLSLPPAKNQITIRRKYTLSMIELSNLTGKTGIVRLFSGSEHYFLHPVVESAFLAYIFRCKEMYKNKNILFKM
ncbi:MAG: hypothetical protein WBM07_09215, partial [Chitinivibrionales bacterium]